MLLPNQLASMRLGLRFHPESFEPHNFAANLDTPPAAYSRNMSAPLVTGQNTKWGDCVETMGCNAAQDFLATDGDYTQIPDETAVSTYSAVTGFNPANPASDQGTDPEAFLDWWQANAIAGVKLKNATQIDSKNLELIRHTIATQSGVFLCVALSVEQQNQRQWFPVGTPGSWGLHAVWCDQYDGGLFFVTSWGERIAVDVSYFTAPGFVIGAYALELVAA